MIDALGHVALHLWAVVVAILLFVVPGIAIARAFDIATALPRVLLPPAWFALGLATWTLALVPSLALGAPWWVTLLAYLAVVVLAVVVARRRIARVVASGLAVADGQPAAGVEPFTWIAIGMCVALAEALRTRMAFDTLFHLGLVRRLLELDAPAFDNLDRVAGAGINPAYVVPTWQSAMAAIAGAGRVDPALVLEAMAPFAVGLAACAAAGLGRLVARRPGGEVAGVAAYAFMRVWFPRRELEGDGVAYAALPGNVALDVLLPLLLAAALLAVAAPRRRPVLVLAGVVAALFVVLHANYAVYLALVGIGLVAWAAIAGPFDRTVRRPLAEALAAVAVPGAVVLVALLPALVLLEHFGAPAEQRIDYHLAGSGAWEVVRPGHLYDSFGAAGMLAMLALPWAAWRARGLPRALVAGGSLALLAAGLVPPLLDLLGSTGSLTLGLRLPRPLGVLLAAAVAIALPDLVDRLRAASAATADRRGRAAAFAVVAAPCVALLALVFAYGYPLARREPPRYGWDWPTLLAAAGLVAILVLLAARRRRGTADDGQDTPAATPHSAAPHAAGGWLSWREATAVGTASLMLGVCLLPSGLVSLRRGAWQSRHLPAATRADDLSCAAGIEGDLRELPAGDVLLADPVTGYMVQSLAPVRLLADFKTWNGRTEGSRAQERVRELDALFDAGSGDEAARELQRLATAHDARWLVVAAGEVEPPLGSELESTDAAGLRELLAHEASGLELEAAGQGEPTGDDEPESCGLALWRVDASELGGGT